MVLVLKESQLRALVGIDKDSLDIVEKAFCWTAEGKVHMPPIMHISVPSNNGDIDIKSAYVEGLDTLTVKLGSGFLDNPGKGLPSSSATMVVLNTETGLCEAVLLENGYLTNLRTGMAGAVAAKYLAPEVVETVGIIGAGAQARFQLECLRLVRDFESVIVHSRRRDQAEAYANEIRQTLGLVVRVSDSVEHLVRSSQVVITTTPSSVPIVNHDWLHPGMHITAVGADLAGKRELASGCLERATFLACDSAAQCLSMGELQYGIDADTPIHNEKLVEVGQLASGNQTFTRASVDITICDLTGMGVQDTAIASLVMKKYRGANI
ncbi:MAG: ectoine utilization protein EutC [Pseudohongiellaceae bacterium]|jgi:ectoine utilization protein EutC